MATHTNVPEPETPARAERRRFSQSYKLRILAQLDKAGRHQIGALLRKEGLYSSVVSTWRRQRDEGTLAAVAPKKRGRKPSKDPMEKENDQLRRRVAQLEQKLETAELIIDVQKKVSQLLGIQLPADTRSEKS